MTRDPRYKRVVEVEGISIDALKALAPGDLDTLLAFGRPITFRMEVVSRVVV